LATKFFKNKALLSLTRPQKDSTKNEPSASDNPEPTPTSSLNAKEVTDTLMKLTGMNQNIPEQPKPQETKEPLEYKIGSTKYTSPTYVVPESEAWNNMSPEDQRAMALAALGRNEVHKFFGGREAIIDGQKTARFSEDNSGQTPEETARLNRQAKMLNKFLDDYQIKKDQEWEEGEKEWNKAKAEGRVPGETTSSGGMNQPMDLADFPDDEDTDQQSAQTKQGANNFLQDLLQPITTYANELNAQEKINNIVKKLGNPRRVKIRRGMKKK
jgi:hypothetical protein